MSRKTGLTPPRRETLAALAKEPSTGAESYPPLQWALANGYAVKHSGRFSDSFYITDAGRALLKETGHGE